MSLENVAGEKECERSIFSSSQYRKKRKTFVSISLRELWENRNNKQQQKRKPKIKYTDKKNTQEKQENVEEKSKRLNFNAAISLAWRGRVRITAWEGVSGGYKAVLTVQGTGHRVYSVNLTVRPTHDKRAGL